MYNHILSIVLFTPLVGAFILLLIPRENKDAIRWLANIFAFLGFAISLPLVPWFWAVKDQPGFKLMEGSPNNWIPSISASYMLGIDGISFLLIMLTTLLGWISILSSWDAIQDRVKEYYIWFLVLQTGMLGVFMSLDFFLFYAFWEVMLVPMFPFHTWLPDAHVEAPTAGSVILAGVLLKMGTYGLIRFNLPLFPAIAMDHTVRKWMITLSIIGIIYGALVSLMQKDMKKLVAYSSVSHLGFCTLGIFALTPLGLSGSVLQQINHGISTGALFLIVGILYERRHTREISEYGGISNVMPLYATITMIMFLSSMGLPLLNGFVGEFTILQGTFMENWKWAAWAVPGVILAAAYLLWLYQRVFFGTVTNPKNEKLRDLTPREMLTFAPLVIAAFWIGLYPKPFFQILEQPVNQIVQTVRPGYPTGGAVNALTQPVPAAGAAAMPEIPDQSKRKK